MIRANFIVTLYPLKNKGESMIDQATIDRILDAAQIVDVVSEFVTLRNVV